MMETLTALENSALGTWVRESPSMFAYTGILTLHAIGLAFVVGLSWTIALRNLGFVSDVPLPALENLYPVLWAGFWLNVVSGIPLLISNVTKDLLSPVFQAKLTFIALAAIATLRLQRRQFRHPSSPRSGDGPKNNRLLAAASLGFWAAAIIAGRLSEYPNLFGIKTH